MARKSPEIKLTGVQIKSLAKARKVARALDTLEVECGIGPTWITFENVFLCPDIDWNKLDKTPMQRSMRKIVAGIMKRKRRQGYYTGKGRTPKR